MNINRTCGIETCLLEATGNFPNHPHLPLLLYAGALDLRGRQDVGEQVASLFEANGWGGTWLDGVYPFHHYHSNTHEVLGCYRGEAVVQFGGPAGPRKRLAAGDVAVLPAGTAHCRVEASPAFAVVGAYPGGARYDMCRGRDGERPDADRRIARTPLPGTDPVFGSCGGVLACWSPHAGPA